LAQADRSALAQLASCALCTAPISAHSRAARPAPAVSALVMALPGNIYAYLASQNNGQVPDYVSQAAAAAAGFAVPPTETDEAAAAAAIAAFQASGVAEAANAIAGYGQAGVELTAEGDWICPQCRNSNFRRRLECNLCQYPRPSGGGLDQPQYEQPQHDRGRNKRDKRRGNQRNQQEKLPLPANLNLYITGLPADMDQAWLKSVFGQYGTVFSSKVLPMKAGKHTASGFVRMPEEDGKKVVDELNGQIPEGLRTPITVTAVLEQNKPGQDNNQKGSEADRGPSFTADQSELVEILEEEADTLYVRGPAPNTGMTTDLLASAFGKYARILHAKLLPGEARENFAAIVRVASIAEATSLIRAFNGQVLGGFGEPLIVRYAKEQQPVYERLAARKALGEQLLHGHIHTYYPEEGNGTIYAEDVFKLSGKKVTVSAEVLDKSRAGVGDTVLFFTKENNKNSDSFEATDPMMRIAADCAGATIECALKGWYRGVANHSKGFGFIDCLELKALFGKDTYVAKDYAGNASVGHVCFNAKLQRNFGDGSLQPVVTHIQSCDENWKPTPRSCRAAAGGVDQLPPTTFQSAFMSEPTGSSAAPMSGSPGAGGGESDSAGAPYALMEDSSALAAPEEEEAVEQIMFQPPPGADAAALAAASAAAEKFGAGGYNPLALAQAVALSKQREQAEAAANSADREDDGSAQRWPELEAEAALLAETAAAGKGKGKKGLKGKLKGKILKGKLKGKMKGKMKGEKKGEETQDEETEAGTDTAGGMDSTGLGGMGMGGCMQGKGLLGMDSAGASLDPPGLVPLGLAERQAMVQAAMEGDGPGGMDGPDDRDDEGAGGMDGADSMEGQAMPAHGLMAPGLSLALQPPGLGGMEGLASMDGMDGGLLGSMEGMDMASLACMKGKGFGGMDGLGMGGLGMKGLAFMKGKKGAMLAQMKGAASMKGMGDMGFSDGMGKGMTGGMGKGMSDGMGKGMADGMGEGMDSWDGWGGMGSQDNSRNPERKRKRTSDAPPPTVETHAEPREFGRVLPKAKARSNPYP